MKCSGFFLIQKKIDKMLVNSLRRTSPRNLLFSHPYRVIRVTDNRKTKPIDIKWLEEKEAAYQNKQPKSGLHYFGEALQEHIDEKRKKEKTIRVKHQGLIFAGVCLIVIQTFFK